MTYCVGLKLKAGLVLLSDTRTNAGLDNISTYRKMFFFEQPGDRIIAIMTAGSLSVTQTTLGRLQEAIDDPEADETTSIMKAGSMLQVATIIGDTLNRTRREIAEQTRDLEQQASASMILAGQRRGGEMRLFLIYPQGNFIMATEDTPFLQIGEHKYGKPILDRVVTPDTSLADAQKAVLLSMDSTLRSNLSVGMPLDLAVIERPVHRGVHRRQLRVVRNGAGRHEGQIGHGDGIPPRVPRRAREGLELLDVDPVHPDLAPEHPQRGVLRVHVLVRPDEPARQRGAALEGGAVPIGRQHAEPALVERQDDHVDRGEDGGALGHRASPS